MNKTAFGLFDATNLELVFDSIGNSVGESVETLARLTANYIMEIMQRNRQ